MQEYKVLWQDETLVILGAGVASVSGLGTRLVLYTVNCQYISCTLVLTLHLLLFLSNRWSQSKPEYHCGTKYNCIVIQYAANSITINCSSYEVAMVNCDVSAWIFLSKFHCPHISHYRMSPLHIAHGASKLTAPSTTQECTLASRPWIQGHMTLSVLLV